MNNRLIMEHWKFPAVITFAVVAALTTLSAEAATKKKRHMPRQEVAARVAGEPIMAIVSIKSQQVTLYDADGWILRAPVSTGTRGRETPAGIFAIVEKNKEHRSNMYDDASMPNMQRITWNGIALHGGPLPGYAASHGCVRLPYGFASKIFDKTRIGMRVIISPDDAVPIEFSHPELFSPNSDVIAAIPERVETLSQEAAEAANTANAARKTAKSTASKVRLQKKKLRKLKWSKKRADTNLRRADKALAAANKAKGRAEERLQQATAEATELAAQIDTAKTDLEVKVADAAAADAVAKDTGHANNEANKVLKAATREAALQKTLLRKLEKSNNEAEASVTATQLDTAKSDLELKVAAATAAAAVAKETGHADDEANKALKAATHKAALQKASLRKLKKSKKRADIKLRHADKALAAADQAKARAEERLRKATDNVTELATQIENAESDLQAKIAAAAAAKRASKAAKIRKSETAQVALDARLALEPVSVFISRATQKLYVRRNTHKPAPDGGGEVFDSSIEVPVSIRDPDRPIGTHVFTAMSHNRDGLRWAAVTIDDKEDARSALDRITIPEDVLNRIAPTALPRSSIVISDEPLSKETNYRTEFVAVLSNQPQGGFITRKPTMDRIVMEDDRGFFFFFGNESDRDRGLVPRGQWKTPSFINH